MGRFRKADGTYDEYDSTKDKERLIDTAKQVADDKAGDSLMDWIKYWLGIEEVRSSDQPSIQQTKQDLRDALK